MLYQEQSRLIRFYIIICDSQRHGYRASSGIVGTLRQFSTAVPVIGKVLVY
jgi:hypothetical protein